MFFCHGITSCYNRTLCKKKCRYLRLACGAKYFLDLKSDDNIYTTLPLYHSAGNVAGVGLCVMCGVTVTIRKKFSASNFWKDCVTYNCTVIFIFLKRRDDHFVICIVLLFKDGTIYWRAMSLFIINTRAA